MRIKSVISTMMLVIVIFLASTIVASGQNSQPVVVFHGDRDTPVRVVIADSLQKQALGLMNLRHLPANQGMLFVFQREEPHPFWMKDTYIPLDQIYINSKGVIVDINHDAKPLSLSWYYSRPSRFVVEVNGGFCDRHGIHIGNKVSIRD